MFERGRNRGAGHALSALVDQSSKNASFPREERRPEERWAFSDLMRMLIILGASVSWLRLRKQENLDRLGKIARLGRMADMLDEAGSHKPRTRIYRCRER